MKMTQNKFLHFAAFLFLVFTGHSVRAQQNSDLIEALQTNYQIILQLDQINLSVAVGYVDCFCKIMNESGKTDPRCQERRNQTSFSQQKINHLGQEITEVKICSDVVTKLTKRVQKTTPKIRSNLALISSYQKALRENTPNIHLERPQNRKNLARLIVDKQTAHQKFMDSPPPLLALTGDEIEAVLDQHFAYADKIRESFLVSKNYQLLYGSLNSKSVLDYLKDDISGPLALEIDQLKKQNKNISFEVWYTPENLKQLYRHHLVAEKQKIVADLLKDYRRALDSLPILNYIQSADPQMTEIFSALLVIEKNAKQRVKESLAAAKDIYGVPLAGEEDYWISQFAFLMDNRLGVMNLDAVLKNKNKWSDERISDTTSYLLKLRAQQKKRIEFGKNAAVIGSAVLCLAPFPGTKALTAGGQLLFRNVCMLGLSGGTNTYFLLESQSEYEQKIRNFLSSADGWNQMTPLDQVIEYKENFDSWLLFYALEFLPAYDLAKFMFLLR